jgi:hypothetical protein
MLHCLYVVCDSVFQRIADGVCESYQFFRIHQFVEMLEFPVSRYLEKEFDPLEHTLLLIVFLSG